MNSMTIGVLTLHLRLPGVTSLKEKRGLIKPVIARLHREFNVSVAEIDRHDQWQETILGCAVISNDSAHTQQVLQQVAVFTERNWPNMTLIDDHIELIG